LGIRRRALSLPFLDIPDFEALLRPREIDENAPEPRSLNRIDNFLISALRSKTTSPTKTGRGWKISARVQAVKFDDSKATANSVPQPQLQMWNGFVACFGKSPGSDPGAASFS
jgi:hypothetical protein